MKNGEMVAAFEREWEKTVALEDLPPPPLPLGEEGENPPATPVRHHAEEGGRKSVKTKIVTIGRGSAPSPVNIGRG